MKGIITTRKIIEIAQQIFNIMTKIRDKIPAIKVIVLTVDASGGSDVTVSE
jgi:lipoate synthase